MGWRVYTRLFRADCIITGRVEMKTRRRERNTQVCTVTNRAVLYVCRKNCQGPYDISATELMEYVLSYVTGGEGKGVILNFVVR